MCLPRVQNVGRKTAPVREIARTITQMNSNREWRGGRKRDQTMSLRRASRPLRTQDAWRESVVENTINAYMQRKEHTPSHTGVHCPMNAQGYFSSMYNGTPLPTHRLSYGTWQYFSVTYVRTEGVNFAYDAWQVAKESYNATSENEVAKYARNYFAGKEIRFKYGEACVFAMRRYASYDDHFFEWYLYNSDKVMVIGDADLSLNGQEAKTLALFDKIFSKQYGFDAPIRMSKLGR